MYQILRQYKPGFLALQVQLYILLRLQTIFIRVSSHLGPLIGLELRTDPLFQPLGPSSLQLTARFSKMFVRTFD